jgi:lipopolysaccharide assembly outer membrane protein LptD (OstA)
VRRNAAALNISATTPGGSPWCYPLAGVILVLYWLGCPLVWAQDEPTVEGAQISAASVLTWTDGPSNVVQLEGNISIDLDQTHLTADGAVIWITPIKGAVLDEMKMQIALLGHAQLTQPGDISRTGDTLFVTADVRGDVNLSAPHRESRNFTDSDLYKRAVVMKPVEAVPATTQPGDENWLATEPWMVPATQPTTQPTTMPAIATPVAFSAALQKGWKTGDGTIAMVLEGDVKLFERRPNGDYMEMQAERAVLFTPLHSLLEVDPGQRMSRIEDAVTAAYLEGDVRLVHSPAIKGGAEQRLTCDRVYYDFRTDRAVLTDAVIHTVDLKNNLPLIVRAQVVHQLSEGEYVVEKARLTNSSFATPSFSMGMRKAYIRQIDTGDLRYGSYNVFVAHSVTVNAYNVPFFYFPVVGGVMNERGNILRQAEVQTGSRFGTSVLTQFGLYESLGKIPPLNTDMSYGFDYYGKRGPGGNIQGTYQGGEPSDILKEPWSFSGDFTGFFVHDTGFDDLGRHRLDVTPPTEDRGRIWMRHTQFLPDDWEVQMTLAYVSDPTFLEEWYPTDFFERGTEDTSIYLKHQKDDEAFTFLIEKQLDNFVTSSDNQQEQAEVERLPEIGYNVIGDSLGGDNLTAFSQNLVSGLDFRKSDFDLVEQGFRPSEGPGAPSFGTTGMPGNIVYRGDFRQELDYPFTAGQFRLVPYVLGRYTVYSDSPVGTSRNRLLAGTGVKINTDFWKVDDTVESELFDLHRLRHVIEPELNLFTSTSNVNRDQLLQYDESIDEINAISVAQLALHQQWETKRGGADRWRSVDFFDWNIEANFFSHKPNDELMNPTKFRGLYFASLPEASLPRNSLDTDATWRVSDTTAIVGDAEYNLDTKTLATASIGVAVQRSDRVAYFIGQRYIEPLSSNILTTAVSYELTSKYTVAVRQSYDFGNANREVTSDFSIIRHFDRFFVSLTLRYDEIGDNNGFEFNIYPEGLGKASEGTAAFQSVIGPQ